MDVDPDTSSPGVLSLRKSLQSISLLVNRNPQKDFPLKIKKEEETRNLFRN